jgi:DNA-binding IclR family transcriptional regulator
MKTLEKAINILELFLIPEESPREEISLTELAKLSGFNKSTVRRMVSILVTRGYLKQREKRGKYTLGTKFLDFSGVIKKRSKIRDKAVPYLVKLAQSTKESVILSILNGQYAAYNETIPSEYALKIVPDEGTKAPLYCTGVGKVFLASMTEPEVENYINSTKLESHTANTITNPDYLKAHITIIAKEGVAFDDEEFILGIRSVATGIRDNEGKTVAAVGVLGPSVRLSRQRMTEIAPDVKKCAAEISQELGYKN